MKEIAIAILFLFATRGASMLILTPVGIWSWPEQMAKDVSFWVWIAICVSLLIGYLSGLNQKGKIREELKRESSITETNEGTVE